MSFSGSLAITALALLLIIVGAGRRRPADAFDVDGDANANSLWILPGLGDVLFTTGASSVYPEIGQDKFANIALAMAALHVVRTPKGVQVG